MAAVAVGEAIADVGAAIGLSTLGASIGAFAANGILALGGASGLGAALSAWTVVASVAEMALYKPKVSSAGSAQQFKADTNAGISVTEGRYGVGGSIVYLTTSGGANKAVHGAAGNEFLTACVILSGLGPIQAIESLRFNDTILSFAGQDCSGGYVPGDVIGLHAVPYHNNGDGTFQNDQFADRAWQNTQLGAVPAGHFAPPDKLTASAATLTEWDGTKKFSSFAASFLTLVYDVGTYAGGQPQPLWTIQGISKWDPRLDDSYPGGAGPQRWLGAGAASADLLAARATHGYNTNPFISGLNYALGYWLPDAAGV